MELRLKYTYSKLSPVVIHPQVTQRTMGSMQIPPLHTAVQFLNLFKALWICYEGQKLKYQLKFGLSPLIAPCIFLVQICEKKILVSFPKTAQSSAITPSAKLSRCIPDSSSFPPCLARYLHNERPLGTRQV